MAEISNTEADSIFKGLAGEQRKAITTKAFSRTIERWQDERLEDYQLLEEAHHETDSSFGWAGFEFMRVGAGSPETNGGVKPTTITKEAEPRVREIALEFGKDVLSERRDLVCPEDGSPANLRQ